MEFKQHTPGCMGAFEQAAYDVWEAIRRTEPLGEIPAWHEVDEAQRQHVMDALRKSLAQVKGQTEVRLTVAVTAPNCTFKVG